MQEGGVGIVEGSGGGGEEEEECKVSDHTYLLKSDADGDVMLIDSFRAAREKLRGRVARYRATF